MTIPTQTSADHWNRRLRYFRFHFAHGGIANDPDDLSAGIRFTRGEAGLLDAFARLGVELARLPADMPRREIGRSYDSADWSKYADPIAAYPDFACPDFVRVEGMPAYLTVAADSISICVSGAHGYPWVIDEQDFRNALELETLLPQRGLSFIGIATRTQIETLFHALQARRLPDLRTLETIREELKSRAAVRSGATDVELAAYAELRQSLGAEFADDEIWHDAHAEIFALVQSALDCAASHSDANPQHVAHRCPGFATDIINRVCADVRFSQR